MGLKKYLNSIISNFNWMGENIIVYLMGIVFSIISFAIGVFLVLFGDYMANKVSSKANCDTIKENKEE